MEYNNKKREIILNRKLSNLDKFVLDFIKILEKYADYTIISGYVSIILGRTRTTEDVDLFIKKISFGQFSQMYKKLEESGFWCINAEKPESIFSYLEDKKAVRFAKGKNPVPNIEIKFPKRNVDEETFNDFLIIKIGKNKLKISSLERHIAFKRYYLGSDKDKEDAIHIEELFKDKIDYKKVNRLKEIIKRIKEDERKNQTKEY